jgi:HEAT repeat protein
MPTFALILLAASIAPGQARPARTVGGPVARASAPHDAAAKARQLLGEAIQDKNPDIRKEAVIAFSLLRENDELLKSFARLFDDKDVIVRLAAVSVLGDLKDRQGIPLLKKALNDPVPEVEFAAAKVLYQLHDPAGKPALLAVFSRQSKAASSYLATKERNTLRLLHTPTRLFVTIAQNAADMVVPVPGLGLGVSSVQGILSDPGSSARATVLLLMTRERDPAVHQAVKAGLTDKEWSVRAAAVHVVAMHPDRDLRPNLVALMDDKRAAVRFRAAAAYLRLEPKANASVNPRPPARHT